MMSARFVWPAEWAPQDGVLLAWPHEGTDWADDLSAVEDTYVALVTAIARFEVAMVCVASDALEARARARLSEAGANLSRVRFVRAEYDDTWLRDSGPITLTDGRAFRLLDFHFTGWGGKFGAERDDQLVAHLVAMRCFANAGHKRIDWALEGGGIDGDGSGTILTTWQCLSLRHPNESREQISHLLMRELGAERVLWLDHGHLQGDDTDAHIDTLARFADRRTIVYQGCNLASDAEHFEALGAMARELAALRTSEGEPYRLIELPWATPIHDVEGRRLAASYANFLIINGAVLMPAYGDAAADTEAARRLADAFPGREIVAVPCRPLIGQNGSLHCVTMQLPAGVLNA